MVQPVILCGGSGTRLWPLSKKSTPKQYLPLFHSESIGLTSDDKWSLFQLTLRRMWSISPMVLLVTAAALENTARQQADTLSKALGSSDFSVKVILEPLPKDTAAAICLAALAIMESNPDEILLIAPADHYIPDYEALSDSISVGMQAAKDNYLVTFGIKPTCPETGYGYIEKDMDLYEGVFTVKQFKEKPDLENALKFLEIHFHARDIYQLCEAALRNDLTVDTEIFSKIHPISFDYAVLERSGWVVVVPTTVTWSDVGSWKSLWEVKDKDDNGNYFEGEVISRKTTDSYIVSTEKLIGVIGMNRVAVIESEDSILVVKLEEGQDVKKIVAQVSAKYR